uniref:Pyruvate dehydrogenase phosphatase regulatory subunit, mitochondrial n=1 Tax=Strigamia maritima TaxID=126957 RepID=T1IHI3_STRMM
MTTMSAASWASPFRAGFVLQKLICTFILGHLVEMNLTLSAHHKCIFTLIKQCHTSFVARNICSGINLHKNAVGKVEDSLKPPKTVRVVVCGGGVTGSSVIYHLSQLGWTDVVLIEQGKIGGGSTRHAAGLLGQLKQSTTESRICQNSVKLYKELEEKGFETGWKQCGSLLLARTKDRFMSLRRLKSTAGVVNIDCDLVSPEEIKKLCPLIRTDDLQGGLYVPADGVGDPVKTCKILIQEATGKGIKVIENCTINRVITRNSTVIGVDTNKGMITCDYFVNCGGFWARNIGRKSNPPVKVPLHPCEHYYLHTRTMDGLDPMMPVVRDYDGHIYFREHKGALLAGGFEPTAKPIYHESVPGILDTDLQEDWDHFYILLEQMLHRIPDLGDAVVEKLNNNPECFTPDCKWIVGEAPELKNYFVATGMKTIGIVAAGGVGKITAEWIVNGQPSMDVWQLDIQRFLGLHNNKKFLKDRMREVPGLHYKLNYPFGEFETGRNLRMSPIYPRLRAAGAVFCQTMGYERPAYFDSGTGGDVTVWNEPCIAVTKTFGKPPWFENMKSEYLACRERVGLLDYSSFTKIIIKSNGKEAVELLQYLCSNDVDIPVGSIIHTGMQNSLGGYENDCSLARLAENEFFIMAPTIQQTRCMTWIKRHIHHDASITLTDVTSFYTAICIMGPLSQSLLADVTEIDTSRSHFPFFTFKELNVCLASGIRVMNLTHTGELGWVLYVPTEHALHIYDGLLNAGQKYGLKLIGYYAMRTLRIERFYAFWGQDLDTTTTPIECGRAFRVKFNYKGDFIGKEALIQQRKEGVKRKYIQLLLDDHDINNDPWPWGREPIYRNGKIAGMTSTTCYGLTLEKQVCLGYVECIDEAGIRQLVSNDYVIKGNYEVEIAGRKFSAKANLHSPQLPTVGMVESLSQDRYEATQQ